MPAVDTVRALPGKSSQLPSQSAVAEQQAVGRAAERRRALWQKRGGSSAPTT